MVQMPTCVRFVATGRLLGCVLDVVSSAKWVATEVSGVALSQELDGALGRAWRAAHPVTMGATATRARRKRSRGKERA